MQAPARYDAARFPASSFVVCGAGHLVFGVEPALRCCARCRVAYYCSRTCQIAHWRQEHRAQCTVLAELRVPREFVRCVPTRSTDPDTTEYRPTLPLWTQVYYNPATNECSSLFLYRANLGARHESLSLELQFMPSTHGLVRVRMLLRTGRDPEEPIVPIISLNAFPRGFRVPNPGFRGDWSRVTLCALVQRVEELMTDDSAALQLKRAVDPAPYVERRDVSRGGWGQPFRWTVDAMTRGGSISIRSPRGTDRSAPGYRTYDLPFPEIRRDEDDPATFTSEADVLSAPTVCIMCSERLPRARYLPCKHMLFCRTCANRYYCESERADTCPMCKAVIGEVLDALRSARKHLRVKP